MKGKSILITGGTGSFGKAFIRNILSNHPDVNKLIVFSRDELKQYEMQNEFNAQKYPQIRFFLGDIRDKERLKRAFQGIDIIVHAAALKQVPAAEYNPFEFIKTNVIGTQNVVECALDTGSVTNVVALSTDKASSPANLYGASKLCADRLVISAENIKGNTDKKFSVVRYGNVLGSRGSVLPLFLNQKKEGRHFTITDETMTRFNITLGEGVSLVLWAIEHGVGGEIIVPKIPSYHITDMAKAIDKNLKVKLVGKRVGEKLHEEMISVNDSQNVADLGDKYLIMPQNVDQYSKKLSKFKWNPVENNFYYSSDRNDQFLSVSELQDLIKKEQT